MHKIMGTITDRPALSYVARKEQLFAHISYLLCVVALLTLVHAFNCFPPNRRPFKFLYRIIPITRALPSFATAKASYRSVANLPH